MLNVSPLVTRGFAVGAPHCVAAKGRATPHTTRSEPGDAPEFGVDYVHFADAKETGLPSIACKDRETHSFADTTLTDDKHLR